MKKIDKDVMDTWRGMGQIIRNRKDFSDNIMRQLKGYEISAEFLREFSDVVDMSDISSFNLPAEAIRYLDSIEAFDEKAWEKAIEYKDIGILADDAFVAKYSIDVNGLLSKARIIPDEVFDKYIDACSDSAAVNMMLCYNGDHCSLDKALERIDILGAKAVGVKCVRNEIARDANGFAERLFSVGKPLSPFLVLSVLDLCYAPAAYANRLDSISFTDVSDKTMNAMSVPETGMYIEMLRSICQKYPTPIVANVMEKLHFSARAILMNRDLLREFLIDCDDIPESTLDAMQSDFIQCGLRPELVAYSKNYGYVTLLTILTLS